MTTFCFIVRPRSIRRLNFDLKFSAVQIYNTLEIIDEHIINRLKNILHVKDEGILEQYCEFVVVVIVVPVLVRKCRNERYLFRYDCSEG